MKGKGLVAMGLVLAGAVPALAEEGSPRLKQASTAFAQVSIQRFDIPAQPLTSALMKFSEITGLQLFFDATIARDLGSPGVSGTMTSEEALRRLLQGAPLGYRFTNPTTVTLERATGAGGAMTLDPVTVEGRRPVAVGAEIGNLPQEYTGGQVARGGKLGLLGNRDFMDTPFNQSSYTAETIANQQARTIADVVANDPSVRASWPDSGYTQPLMIRGFAASNQDVSYGGLFGVAPAFTVAMEMAERVEVLKGPTALLTGMQPLGSVGGGVNIVPKRATDTPIATFTPSYISEGQLGGHVDFGRRYGSGKEFGVRFNGLYRDGDTGVEHQSKTLGTAVAGLDFQGERVRFSADLGYQAQNTTAPTLITFVNSGVAVPKAPDASKNWFFPWSWSDTYDQFGAGRVEFDVTPDWTAHVALGAKQTDWERLTYFPTITNSAGDLTGTPGHLNYRYLTDTEETGLRGRVETGPVAHQLTFATTRYHQATWGKSVSAGSALTSNLYNPSSAGQPGISDLTRSKLSDTVLTSMAVGDVLSVLDERIQLIGGLRNQSIEVNNFSSTTGAQTSQYDKTAVTPAVGLVLKPLNNVALYGNYIEGLQQGTIVGSTYANAGEVLPPFISKQTEAGLKVDWGRVATTLSAFQITQPSGTAPSSTGTFTADGEQRNRGLELNVFGQISDTVRLLGGVTLMDATLTKTSNGTNDGKDAPGVPDMQINLGSEWDTPFAPGLTLSGRVIHTSSQKVDNANTQSIPDWTRFDLGARYKLQTRGTPVTIRANVENLFDNDYWASAAYAPGWLAPGAPRTFLLSTAFTF